MKKRIVISIDLTEEEIQDLNSVAEETGTKRTPLIKDLIRLGYLQKFGRVLGFRRKQ